MDKREIIVIGVLAPEKLRFVSFAELREFPLLLRMTARGIRGALERWQAPAKRISRHLQVHPGSRARRARAK